ncbi:cytochrome P450 6a9-like [Musca vetustissima]|uniref:cytochrome P450 6a9-like n=1 Tax=Musca vetustissima TaxID=27455 RepID=UPI002AB6C19B|nr:cytochrome P450 6a9-like [Musca vetustissima]
MSVSGILISVAVVLLLYAWRLFYKNITYWKSRHIPCDPPHWLVGNLRGVVIQRPFSHVWQEYYLKYRNAGPFAGFYWFTKPGVFVVDPKLIKLILIKDFAKFADRGMYCNEADDPLTGSLFNLYGQHWRFMRNKITPTFTSSKMKAMFSLVRREAQELVKLFQENIAMDPILDIKDLISRFTIDVIGSCAFGIEIDSMRKPDAEFRKMCRRAFVEQRPGIALRFSYPQFARRLHLKPTMADVEKYFMRIVRDTMQCREESSTRRNDFMDLLIDLKNNKGEDGLPTLSFGQVAAQAFSFLLAGFETSSTLMGFALYELAQHVQEQEKVRQEIREVLDKYDQEFSYDCMKEMVYLQQIIQETMRLHTSLSVLNRMALEDYVVPDHPDYIIRKGMPILIPSAAIHRDERYYPQPEKFNPDNFSPQKITQRDPILYLPFGEGPHNCVGMRFGKMQVIIGLALLLHNFRFSICDRTMIPMEYDKQSFLTSPTGGIYLRVDII